MLGCADLLACPECGQDLTARDRSLRCARGHSFDIARQGYVSLLTGAATKMTGDTPEMLDARAAFQGVGHFAPIAGALARTMASVPVRTPDSAPAAAVLEIGAGTGYYLAAILDARPEARGLALDVSKAAARRAARAHPRAGSVLADAWRGLPVRDGVMDAVVAVFAPRNAAEIARVLTPEGRFVVVTPTSRHLAELIAPLGMVSVDAAKEDRLAESLGERFELLDRNRVEYSMNLTHTDIANVAGMGPSAHHAAAERAERITALPEVSAVTASVTVSVYRRH
ncbi:methyltransferase domain-containing protein [Nocardia sp. 2]|uniref:Methyltransferase domain-containing protein n=1 Tax=Nocardia acididurans TaxID=2802282 RepID=A0ABS1M6F9_9NOCA|nr:methyltransferase domain-containing protein [Nocardia acididurans]MBL1076124.1 methyltransferase domain-containing protein [Nocardia acididurans]